MNDYLENCAIIFMENSKTFSLTESKYAELLHLTDSMPCKKYWVINDDSINGRMKTESIAIINAELGFDNALSSIIKQAIKDNNKKFMLVSICALQITTGLILEGFLNLKVLDISVGPTREGGVYLIGFKDNDSQFLLNKEWESPLLYKSILKDLGDEKLAMYRLPFLL